jgi:hypothetical protein
MKKSVSVPAEAITLVAPGESFRSPFDKPIAMGSIVRLNSGSPSLLAVDIDGDKVTVAWQAQGGTEEMTLPEYCFHLDRGF